MMFLNWVVKGMFKGVLEEEVIKVVGSDLYIGGEKILGEKKSTIVREAQRIKNSHTWNLLKTRMIYQSNLTQFNKSKDVYDLFFGKAILYNIEMIDKILTKLSKVSIDNKKSLRRK